MRLLISAAALAFALTACGGDDEPDTVTPTSDVADATPSVSEKSSDSEPTESQPTAGGGPVAAVTDWIAAYANGDGASACALQTEAYTEDDLASSVDQGIIEEGTSCEDAVPAGLALAEAFGVSFEDPKVELVSESNDSAKVRVTLQGSDGPQIYNVALIDGRWLVDGEVG
jgi:hypothetical protein